MNQPAPKSLIYILPNLFTASSIFVGMISVISSIHGEFEKAAWMILLALVFDGLDGKVARLTNTCSKFGIEFDSLADLFSFGVAPSILIYMYIGEDFGKIGIVVSALFVTFAAIRLARFNVMTAVVEPSVFIGVPTPTAAVFMAILTLLFEKYSFLVDYKVTILFFAVMISVLMVSNIRYPSFKKLSIEPRHRTRLLVALVSVAVLFYIYPVESFSLFFIGYIFFGPIRASIYLYKKRLSHL